MSIERSSTEEVGSSPELADTASLRLWLIAETKRKRVTDSVPK